MKDIFPSEAWQEILKQLILLAFTVAAGLVCLLLNMLRKWIASKACLENNRLLQIAAVEAVSAVEQVLDNADNEDKLVAATEIVIAKIPSLKGKEDLVKSAIEANLKSVKTTLKQYDSVLKAKKNK